MIDWQIIAVALIVGCAALYIGRHLYRALRTFRTDHQGPACASGCGNCGDEGKPANKSPHLINIKRASNRTPN